MIVVYVDARSVDWDAVGLYAILDYFTPAGLAILRWYESRAPGPLEPSCIVEGSCGWGRLSEAERARIYRDALMDLVGSMIDHGYAAAAAYAGGGCGEVRGFLESLATVGRVPEGVMIVESREASRMLGVEWCGGLKLYTRPVVDDGAPLMAAARLLAYAAASRDRGEFRFSEWLSRLAWRGWGGRRLLLKTATARASPR